MGASESKATSAFTLKEAIWADGDADGSAFNLHRAVNKATGQPASVFTFRKIRGQPDDGDDVAVLGKAVQRLRTIRHPGIIKFINADLDQNGVFIATEPVTPLSKVLDSLSPEEVSMGIYNILKTVDFLHRQELSHNNIQMDSVFVTGADRKWVLGGMEYVTSFDENPAAILPKVHLHFPKDSIPPEDVTPTKQEGIQPDARDAYALGKLISGLIVPFMTASKTTKHTSSVFVWGSLQSAAERLSSQDPADRPRVEDVLHDSFFEDNIFINVVEKFLKEIRAIDPEIKRERFSHLAAEIRLLPPAATVNYVLPLVLTRDTLSETGAKAFYDLLFVPKIGKSGKGRDSAAGILPVDIYDEQVLPFIEEMLKVRTYNVRMVMLELFDRYLPELLEWDKSLLHSILIPELVAGLEEADDAIYILSLYSLSSLVPRLCLDTQSATPIATSRDGSTISLLNANTEEATQPIGAGITSMPFSHEPRSTNPSGLHDETGEASGAPKTVRKKTSLPPADTSSTITGAPPIRRKASLVLMPSGPDFGDRKEALPVVRAKRQSVVPMNGQVEKGAATGSGSGTGPASTASPAAPETRYTAQLLVENLIIPHTLNVCVSDTIPMEQKWLVIDGLVTLWKKLCVMEGTSKGSPDVRYLTASIIKCFHLIMKVLPPVSKSEFFCQQLVGDLEGVADSSAMHWLPKVIELGVPSLKDENRDVRRQISQALLRIITFISTAMERAPTVARKRDESSVASKLRRVYGRLARTRTIFPRTGPRVTPTAFTLHAHRSSVKSDANPRNTAEALAFQSMPDLDTAAHSDDGWNDNWGDEPEVPDQPIENQPTASGDDASTHGSVYAESYSSGPVPDQCSVKSNEDAEAERQKKKELLRVKREAREAELRLKRERKKSLRGTSSLGNSPDPSPVDRQPESPTDSQSLNGNASSEASPHTIPPDPSHLPSPTGQAPDGDKVPKSVVEEVDYFKDMEPTITPPSHISAASADGKSPTTLSTPLISGRLAMQESLTDLNPTGDGWGDLEGEDLPGSEH
ncbi:SCY1 protein kinase [Spizellomyces punctatus DAOM BR117]|uniref:SCY1 protein kinase n=1 Tax=Spizellomyces punctatus (strain DAOM BR117) TaxID=645134 RepID=A0A0L0HG60_SPIPD|nr:SCY1 protein kinase [Spizellomyces punctatus DAOM BR117]KND00058.1 SCY1 protein kinase [Spizellomyces punctatus DAOM BR117]|eukprot:XP_016608097.1 SCY1 protein kinase [Spizellomyces punctatus DAOM BR117]